MNPAPRILIVDDDEMVLKVLARALSGAGFDVMTASTPLEGLDDAEQTHPDAILVDLRMPFVNGIGFLYRLRSQPAHLHTPVAIITGDSGLDGRAKAELLTLGAELMFKPLLPDDVVSATRRLLAKGSAARAALPS
jgi:DNA-binding response OmpR family regulator